MAAASPDAAAHVATPAPAHGTIGAPLTVDPSRARRASPTGFSAARASSPAFSAVVRPAAGIRPSGGAGSRAAVQTARSALVAASEVNARTALVSSVHPILIFPALGSRAEESGASLVQMVRSVLAAISQAASGNDAPAISYGGPATTTLGAVLTASWNGFADVGYAFARSPVLLPKDLTTKVPTPPG